MNFIVRWVILLSSVVNGKAVVTDAEAQATTVRNSAATHSRTVACPLLHCFLAGLWDSWDAWLIALNGLPVIERKTKTSPKRYQVLSTGIIQYSFVEVLPPDVQNSQGHVAFVLIEPEPPGGDFNSALAAPSATTPRREFHQTVCANLLTCTFGSGRVTTCLCDFVGPCPGPDKCVGCMYSPIGVCARTQRRAEGLEPTPAAAAAEVETGMIEAAHAISRVFNNTDASVSVPGPLVFKHYVSSFAASQNPKVVWPDNTTSTVTFSVAVHPPTLIP